MRLNAIGTHLLLELRDCEPIQLDSLPFIRETLIAAAEVLGVTILSESFHQFSPQGVTGIISIAESHLSIHTWPEHCYAAVDIFTCGESFDPAAASDLIIQRLNSRAPEVIKINRGPVAVYST
ncbi:MAG: adenosylmethionine decarboxylase [Dehalococcoidia bacterium]